MASLFGLFRVGNEPVIRYTQKGDAVLGLSLAYNYGRKGDDGKKPTQWVDGSLWGKQAEALQQYLTKGSQIVATVDDLHIEEYEGKNGPGHKLVGKIIGLEFVGSKQAAPAQHSASRAATSAPAQPRQAQRPAASGGASGFDDMDDDIPDDIPFASASLARDVIWKKLGGRRVSGFWRKR